MMWPVIKWKSHLLTFLHISLKKEKETITDILQNNNVLLWLRKKIDNSLKNSIYQIGWSFDRFPLLLFTMQLFCDPTLLKTITITKNFHIIESALKLYLINTPPTLLHLSWPLPRLMSAAPPSIRMNFSNQITSIIPRMLLPRLFLIMKSIKNLCIMFLWWLI